MKNRSFVLIAAIIVLVLFAALGVVGINLLLTDIHITLNNLKSTQAFFLAEAGLQYIMEYLAGDSDWSDNSNITKNMAGGTFNIYYITKTQSTATIKCSGTKDNVTRSFTVQLFKKLVGFDYAISTGGNINTNNVVNFNVTGGTQEDVTNFPSVDFNYYYSIADHRVSGNKTFEMGTYSGIWYVDGNVDFRTNVTLNGTVIATGNIKMDNEANITVNANSPYPALVANGNFTFQNSANLNIYGLIFVGADLSGNFLLQQGVNVNIQGVVLVAGNFNLQNSVNVYITYQEPGQVPGFSGLGIPVYSTWQEVD